MKNYTFKQFITWRAAEKYRAKIKTRAQGAAFCGMGSIVISQDHACAYSHEIADFGPIIWDSKKDARGNSATGFYTTNDAQDCIRWAVVKISPTNKKRGRPALFAPVIYWDDSEGVTLCLDDVGTRENAQIWGQCVAERMGESARDDDAKFQAEQQIESERENIATARKEAHEVIKDLRNTPNYLPKLRGVGLDTVKACMYSVRASIKRINLLTNEPWRAVSWKR